MRGIDAGGFVMLRVMSGAATVVVAAVAGFLIGLPFGGPSLISRLWFWLNAPALSAALALGGNVHGAGAPVIYFTFPLEWFLIGFVLSFLFLKPKEDAHA
jgi:hypothetical protein